MLYGKTTYAAEPSDNVQSSRVTKTPDATTQDTAAPNTTAKSPQEKPTKTPANVTGTQFSFSGKQHIDTQVTTDKNALAKYSDINKYLQDSQMTWPLKAMDNHRNVLWTDKFVYQGGENGNTTWTVESGPHKGAVLSGITYKWVDSNGNSSTGPTSQSGKFTYDANNGRREADYYLSPDYSKTTLTYDNKQYTDSSMIGYILTGKNIPFSTLAPNWYVNGVLVEYYKAVAKTPVTVTQGTDLSGISQTDFNKKYVDTTQLTTIVESRQDGDPTPEESLNAVDWKNASNLNELVSGSHTFYLKWKDDNQPSTNEVKENVPGIVRVMFSDGTYQDVPVKINVVAAPPTSGDQDTSQPESPVIPEKPSTPETTTPPEKTSPSQNKPTTVPTKQKSTKNKLDVPASTTAKPSKGKSNYYHVSNLLKASKQQSVSTITKTDIAEKPAEDKELPQTGNSMSSMIVAIISVVAGLFGLSLGNRKNHEA